MSCLLVSEMNCLWISWFANISLHSGLPSSFLKVSFAGHLLWNWSRSRFASFGLFLIALGDGFQKTLQTQIDIVVYIITFPAYIFLKTFIQSLLAFRYLLSGVNFMYGVSVLTSFSFLCFNSSCMLLQSVSHQCISPASGAEYSLFSTPSPSVSVC